MVVMKRIVHKKFSVVKTFSEILSCFTFKKLKESKDWTSVKYNYKKLDHASGMPGYLYGITLNPKVSKQANGVTLKLSQPPEIARSDQKTLFLVHLESLFSMSYSDYENQFLPAPFETDCIDYTTKEFTSSIDCYDKCVINMSLNRLKKIYAGPVVHTNDTHEIIPTAVLLVDPKLYQVKMNISDRCRDECKNLDCNQHLYVPHLKATTQTTNQMFLMYSMSQPKITTICSQKLSLLEFITDVASTFGFWIGISIFSVSEGSIALIQWIKSPYNKKINTKKSNSLNPLESDVKSIKKTLRILLTGLKSFKKRLISVENHLLVKNNRNQAKNNHFQRSKYHDFPNYDLQDERKEFR